MAWTKRQIVSEAFAELALAGYAFDLSPEELQAALVKLDAQMATWTGRGIRIGYAFGLSPTDTDLDQDSGLQLVDVEAVYLALAIKIAGSKGKSLARSTLVGAKQAFDALLSRMAHAEIQQQQTRPGMPRGAGSKSSGSRFTTEPNTDPLQIGGNGALEFLGN